MAIRISKNVAITILFRIGKRIATPVCGLVRNDVDVTMVHTEQPDKAEFGNLSAIVLF